MQISRGIHNSLGEIKSSTDLLTNHTVFSDIQGSLHFKPISDGELPPELALTFIHEVTHHWCFASPVGTAMFVLKMRALREASLLRNQLGRSRECFLDAIVTHDSALAILRPFAEGLALFAEYDAWSLTPAVFSWPLILTAKLSKVVFDKIKGDPTNLARLFLRECRSLPDSRKGKADLLVQQLTGGYLSGYLTVKTFWEANFIRAGGMTRDGDKFLSFMRSYIYDDLSLVSLLLEESSQIESKVERIGRYIPERLMNLLRADLPGMLREYERYRNQLRAPRLALSDSLSVDDIEFVQGISQDCERAAEGQKRLVAALVEMNEPDVTGHLDGGHFAREFANLSSILLGQRHYICIGSDAVDVKVDESGRVLAYELDGQLRAGGKALPGVSPGQGLGTLEVHLVPILNSFILSISRGSKVVLSTITEDGPYNFKEQFIGKLERDFIQLFSELLHRDLMVILKSEWAEAEYTAVLREVELSTKRFYCHMATLRYKRDSEKDIENEMNEDGFWTVLGRDSDFILQFAYLSILASTFSSETEVQDSLRRDGISYEEILARVDAIERRYGIYFLTRGGGAVAAWV
jgi:hypothetical protein